MIQRDLAASPVLGIRMDEIHQDNGVFVSNSMADPRFLVFALDTPVYESQLFGLLGGKSNRTITGSAIAISGGCREVRVENGIEITYVTMTDLLYTLGSVAKPFVERAVSAFVEGSNHVTMVCPKLMPGPPDSRNLYPEWLEAARTAGFDVIESGDYAVAVGTGQALRSFRGWLMGIWHDWDVWIVASVTAATPMVSDLICAARANADIRGMILAFREKMRSEPERALLDLDGLTMSFMLAGPDQQEAVINWHGTDAQFIELLLAGVTSDLGITLYSAGSLTHPYQDGCAFADRVDHKEWRPVPQWWRSLT